MTDWRDEFPMHPDVLYLNHAAVAPWPRRSRDAVCAFAEENMRAGARDYPRWQADETVLRRRLAQLIGAARPDDVALLKNTSEGLSVIAEGIAWQAGERVVITDQEFPSNRIPWQALSRYGVELLEVSLDGEDPEGDIIEVLERRRPRLLSVSSVQFGTGVRLDVARLGRACRTLGVLFCVDAIQSLGVVPFQVEKACADFVVADGHKWLLGPEGLALFWCRPELRDRLTLRQHGWHMVEAAGDYGTRDWRPADSARRFECGSPNMLAAQALSASLSLLQEVGIERVEELVTEKVKRLEQGLKALGMHILTPHDPARRAGILTFVPPDGEVDACFDRLAAAGVVCARRGGGIRLSPHFHTPDAVIDAALAALG